MTPLGTSATPGTNANITTLYQGGGQDEVQRLTFTGGPTGGWFRIRYGTNLDTGNILWNSTPSILANSIQTALNTVLGGNFTVVAPVTPTEFTVTFTGNLGRANLDVLSITNNLLTPAEPLSTW